MKPFGEWMTPEVAAQLREEARTSRDAAAECRDRFHDLQAAAFAAEEAEHLGEGGADSAGPGVEITSADEPRWRAAASVLLAVALSLVTVAGAIVSESGWNALSQFRDSVRRMLIPPGEGAEPTPTGDQTVSATAGMPHKSETPSVVRTRAAESAPTPVGGETPEKSKRTAPEIAPAGSAVSAGVSCFADCNGDGRIRSNEIIIIQRIARGDLDLSACPAGDKNGDGVVGEDDLKALERVGLACGDPEQEPLPAE